MINYSATLQMTTPWHPKRPIEDAKSAKDMRQNNGTRTRRGTGTDRVPLQAKETGLQADLDRISVMSSGTQEVILRTPNLYEDVKAVLLNGNGPTALNPTQNDQLVVIVVRDVEHNVFQVRNAIIHEKLPVERTLADEVTTADPWRKKEADEEVKEGIMRILEANTVKEAITEKKEEEWELSTKTGYHRITPEEVDGTVPKEMQDESSMKEPLLVRIHSGCRQSGSASSSIPVLVVEGRIPRQWIIGAQGKSTAAEIGTWQRAIEGIIPQRHQKTQRFQPKRVISVTGLWKADTLLRQQRLEQAYHPITPLELYMAMNGMLSHYLGHMSKYGPLQMMQSMSISPRSHVLDPFIWRDFQQTTKAMVRWTSLDLPPILLTPYVPLYKAHGWKRCTSLHPQIILF